MAAVEIDFRAFMKHVIGNTSVTVEQGKISQSNGSTPRVWFQRSSSGGDDDLMLDGSPGLRTTMFDVEVHGTNLQSVQELAATLRANKTEGGMHGHFGEFGSGQCLGVFASEQSDDYEFKGTTAYTDDGVYSAALAVKVVQG